MMEWVTKEPDKEDEMGHNAWEKTNKILVGTYKGLIQNGIRDEMQDIIDQWGNLRITKRVLDKLV